MARNPPGVVTYKLTDGSVRYRVRLFHQGRRYKWSGFGNRDEAKHFYQDRKRDLREGRPFPTFSEPDEPPPIRTLRQVIDDYLVTAKLKKNYEGEASYAAFWCGKLGTRPVDAITPTEIDGARRDLLLHGNGRGPVSGATINRYTGWLHHVYRLEIEAERLNKNPCRVFVRAAVRGGQRLPERPAPDVVWTDEELGRLAKELGDGMLYPLLAMLTGLRQEEQFSLRKDAIDLERRIGYLHDPKAGKNQVFHINDDAAQILSYFMQKAGASPFVFPSPRWPMTKPMSAQHWYAFTFKPACFHAGIEIDRQKGRTWHTLRHSFADRLSQLAPILDVQEAGRWGSWQSMRRYLKRNNARASSAVQQLKSPIPLAHFLTISPGLEPTGTDNALKK